jgi:hypothetical protein
MGNAQRKCRNGLKCNHTDDEHSCLASLYHWSTRYIAAVFMTLVAIRTDLTQIPFHRTGFSNPEQGAGSSK